MPGTAEPRAAGSGGHEQHRRDLRVGALAAPPARLRPAGPGASRVAAAGVAGNGGAGNGGAGGGNNQVIVSIDFIGGSVPTGGASGGTLVSAVPMTATETAGVKLAGELERRREYQRNPGQPPPVRRNGDHRDGDLELPGDGREPGRMDQWLRRRARRHAHDERLPGPVIVHVARHGEGQRAASPILPADTMYTSTCSAICLAHRRERISTRSAATTITVSQTGPSPSTFPGQTLAPAGGAGSYVVFHNVSGATFTLTATPGTGPQTRAPVNGIQIVWPPGS